MNLMTFILFLALRATVFGKIWTVMNKVNYKGLFKRVFIGIMT